MMNRTQARNEYITNSSGMNDTLGDTGLQIKAVLDMFIKNTASVFGKPANITVISLYAFLVTAARKSSLIFIFVIIAKTRN